MIFYLRPMHFQNLMYDQFVIYDLFVHLFGIEELIKTKHINPNMYRYNIKLLRNQ